MSTFAAVALALLLAPAAVNAQELFAPSLEFSRQFLLNGIGQTTPDQSGQSGGNQQPANPSGAPQSGSAPAGSPLPRPQKPEQANQPPAQNPGTAQQGPVKPFELHGTLFERYRDDTNHDNGGYSSSDSVTYGAITGTANFSQEFGAYLRFGTEQISPKGQGRDFNTNYYKGTSDYNGPAAFDQFGLIYRNTKRGLTITAGRQDEPLDATSTMYDQSFKVGLHTFLDGVSIIQKIGSGTVQGYAFSEDQYRTSATRNGLYALRGTLKTGPALTLGSTIAHFQSSAQNLAAAGVESTNNYEADVEYKAADSRVAAEYGKSSARTRNDLYYLGGKYGFTPRDAVTVFTYKISDNADLGHDSAYPNGNRGTRYFVEHFFSKPLEIIVYYEVDHQLYASGKSTSTQVTLQYTF